MEERSMIPFTDLKQQYLEIKTDIDAAIARVLDTSNYITGTITDEFETKFAEWVGAESCCATGSGTTALMCSMMAIGIADGDEVITTPHTFISTSEAIIWQGASPVFVDIDDNHQIDVDQIERRITDKTKAILFVDMYGHTPDIDRLREIADKYNLYLIEDAAHSVRSKYKGVQVGSLADLTCFSFNPVKNLGAMGDAGAITGRADLIARARMYNNHGRQNKWTFELRGINARIDNLQAAIVLAKLPYLDSWLDGKRAICHRYTEQLKDYVVTPKEYAWCHHTYYVYVIEVPRRDEFIEYMKTNGVMCNVHYLESLNEQPLFQKYMSEPTPKVSAMCRRIVSLPCYHTLTIDQQDHIINLVKAWVSND
jgi:UDP-2-acetamido-2-deoxy-ribo-hexuluronate aminotransferase